MTISTTSRLAGPFTGDDLTTVFAFAFKAYAAADLYVVDYDTVLLTESLLVLTTDYSVSLNADQNVNPGGSVTLVAALVTDHTMLVTTDLDDLQETDLINQGGFYPETIETSLDKSTIIDQQIQGEVDRCLMLPFSATSGNDLPLPVAETVIGYDDSDPPELRGYTGEQIIGLVDGDVVSVSVDDTTPSYLEAKIAAGTNVSLATLNPAGDEELEISAADPTVKVTSDDTTAGYLLAKLAAGTGVSLTETNPAGDEDVTVALADGTAGTLRGFDAAGAPSEVGPGTAGQLLTSGGAGVAPTFQATATGDTVKVSANDTTAGVLNGKLVAGTNIVLTELNDGGDETLSVAAASDPTVKVTANDSSPNYLAYKVAAGVGITLTELNDGGDEDLEIAVTNPANEILDQAGAVTSLSGTTSGVLLSDTIDGSTRRIEISCGLVDHHTGVNKTVLSAHGKFTMVYSSGAWKLLGSSCGDQSPYAFIGTTIGAVDTLIVRGYHSAAYYAYLNLKITAGTLTFTAGVVGTAATSFSVSIIEWA